MNRLWFFTVPTSCPEEGISELNNFLATHRVLAIEKHFVDNGANSFWSICVTCTDRQDKLPAKSKRQKIDYREILSEQDFAVYVQLRDLRNRLAKEEGMAPYLVFNNEQLAKMVQNRVQSKADLMKISGVGQTKIDKYADQFLPILKQVTRTDRNNETPQNNTGRDS